MAKDYYDILGVAKGASESDIKKAYLKLARKNHPDANPDDKKAKERFQEIQKAYDVLGDEKKRAQYDQFGSAYEQIEQGGGAGPGGNPFQGFDFSQAFGGGATPEGGGGSPFEEIFRQFSGGAGKRGGRRSAPPRRGADLQHELVVPFRTAISGGEARLAIRRGAGNIENLTVKIPPGIEDGKRIRLSGQGDPGVNGQAGDLYIQVKVDDHPYFRRKGADLEVKVPVTLAEAALGAKVEVPTPKGQIVLTIPKGTSSGKRIRVKGHGVSTAAGAGDLFAEVQIVLPEKLDAELEAALKKSDERHPQKPRAELRW
jgi:DnaJ-class molecular chaperone